LCVGIIRPQPQGVAALIDRLVHAACVLESVAEIAVSLRIVRSQTHRFAQMAHRLLIVAPGRDEHPQVQVGIRKTRFQTERLLKVRPRCFELADKQKFVMARVCSKSVRLSFQ